MGIDIEFFVRAKEPLTAGDVNRLSEMVEDRFDKWFGFTSKRYEGLSRTDDGLLEVKTLCRYYGEGYERGNPLPWILLADFFETILPGCEVYYFGDCQDKEEALKNPWTKGQREELKTLYFNVGNAPYHDAFKRFQP